MTTTVRACIAASILVGVFAAVVPNGIAAPPEVPPGWTFKMPKGDVSDGKTTFNRMECAACHTMKGAEVPARGTSGVGPDLSGYVGLPEDYLAESIIGSHTVVAAPGYSVQDGKAGMGNYNHFMTIQELIDLVAFLHAGDPQK